jgi:UDP-glucose:(heptosyl)LPS alpha-1,3-glucosyltransferase
MKIAMILERMNPFRGGKEVYTAQLASALAQRGHRVSILCQSAQWQDKAVEVVVLGRRGLLKAARLKSFVANAGAMIAQSDWDITHAMLPVPGADIYHPHGGTVPGAMQARVRRNPILGRAIQSVEKSLNFRRRLVHGLEMQVVGDPRVTCLCVSPMVAREFETYYGRSQGVRVIYNGVQAPPHNLPERTQWRQEIRHCLGCDPGDTVFLTIATNLALKGVREAIIAMAKCVASDHSACRNRLIVVGSDQYEGFQRQAQLRDVGEQVVFVGRTDQVFRYYAAADVFILLSWYDSCGLTLLEATRWGIPSITTRYAGASEALVDGAGIVVRSPGDTRAVAEAMTVLADPSIRSQYANRCLEIADQFSHTRHVDQVLSLYEEIIRSKKA